MKNFIEKFKYNRKGITLISLVVTIVVLLILAGITIGTLTGDNGIIKNAIDSKEQTQIANEKEIIDRATVQAMGNNTNGNIVEKELQDELDKITNVGITDVKIIRKKIIVEFTDSHRMYYVDNYGNVFEYLYTDLPIMEAGSDFNKRIADYKDNILSITVLDSIDIPENAYQVFGISKEQNETVKACLIPNEENTDMFDLYIMGTEGVETSNCKNMFSDFRNCLTIDLEYLYTDNVKDFGYMFQNCKSLISINLKNLNTSEATYMGSMFANLSNISELDISNFDTSKVTNMASMFSGMVKLETIDLSNFNTSKVTSMNQMFRNCYNLTKIDLSNFNTNSLTRTDYMFYYCYNLKTIYVSHKWINDKITLSDFMFKDCTSLSGAINYDSTKTDMTYANYEDGYFTFKSSE